MISSLPVQGEVTLPPPPERRAPGAAKFGHLPPAPERRASGAAKAYCAVLPPPSSRAVGSRSGKGVFPPYVVQFGHLPPSSQAAGSRLGEGVFPPCAVWSPLPSLPEWWAPEVAKPYSLP
ncbi:hypothetical protein AXG93_115s1120 [Marchantia polymorpha subsp. ruderalis]|uniref:Uncharacterized protein n=1 Tax=Marchantia polymorpha subsp. ruderalis TaxID=1480154 RepID=A0A176W6S8_MARPO|nr:hypothetical protein AXG93_115s1120 [Marchantia polymorpha subsp. ruderalis]